MISPTDRRVPGPGLVFVPAPSPSPDDSGPERARPAAAEVVNHFRDIYFRRCLDRAAACIATGRDDRARQWINEASVAEGIEMPWPDLGRIVFAEQPL